MSELKFVLYPDLTEENNMRQARICSLVLVCMMGILVSGCDTVTEMDDTIILLEKENEETAYSMATAIIDDVVLRKTVTCIYQQTRQQEVSFSVSGKRITKVYVEEGDVVEKGQLIAVLDIGNANEEIRRLEYQIARNNLLMETLEENEKNTISSMMLPFKYNSGRSEEEKVAVENAVDKLQQSNRYLMEDYQDAIVLDTLELEKVKENVRQGSLYSEMAGIVTSVKDNLEGSTSNKDEVILKIIDNTDCLFAVSDIEYAPYFTEEEEVEMTIISGNGAGRYRLIPYEINNWSDVLLFTMAEGQDNYSFSVGSKGNISVILDRRKEVLTVPTEAVHEADGRFYVYIIGDDNMREIKWIETGLHGDNLVEILSGLEEGDKVILK
jgi:multidrug efflux pump subunit AcrA (membrane-fusion protein)